ncbi:hypothetical protein HDU76_012596, partial [Blyttiomyces sp. JEL0837]
MTSSPLPHQQLQQQQGQQQRSSPHRSQRYAFGSSLATPSSTTTNSISSFPFVPPPASTATTSAIPRPIHQRHITERDPLISSPHNYIPSNPPPSSSYRSSLFHEHPVSAWFANLVIPLRPQRTHQNFPTRHHIQLRNVPVESRNRCLRPTLFILSVLILVLVILLIFPDDRFANPNDGKPRPGFPAPGTPIPRLLDSVVPISYTLSLTVDPALESFLGTVAIALKLGDGGNLYNLTLHAGNDLSFTVANVSLFHASSEGGAIQPVNMTRDFLAETVTFGFENEIVDAVRDGTQRGNDGGQVDNGSQKLSPAQPPTLVISYVGVLGDRTMRGFYRSPLNPDKGTLVDQDGSSSDLVTRDKKTNPAVPTTEYFAATHFEPTWARLAFPNFDEPAFKATFELTVLAPDGYMVRSNMPVEESRPVQGRPGWLRWGFKKSPVMSSYLFAWAVGKVGSVEGIAKAGKGGVQVKVFTRVGEEENGRFALKVALASLELYEKQFGITFPVPKLDLFPIPDFSGEAMENWGLSVFEEAALMATENDSLDKMIYTANLVAHEIAHHWLGDLTTMAWWNDLWLNEGFAEWAQYMGTIAAFPDWNLQDYYFEMEHTVAFAADESSWTRPISLSTVDSSQVPALFDDISYDKGASVIQMFEMWLDKPDPSRTPRGPLNTPSLVKKPSQPDDPDKDIPCGGFCRTVRRFLTSHSHGVATTSNFLDALSAEDPSGVISGAMEGWLYYPGFPVVWMDKEGTLRQERFTLWKVDGVAKGDSGIGNGKKIRVPKEGDGNDDGGNGGGGGGGS